MKVRTARNDAGYAMVALLVGMAVMAVFLTVALPAWSTAARREKEEELVFRGQQYARAIVLFQRKYANTFPPNVDLLVNDRYLRKKYKDPITNADFRVVYANQQNGGQPGAVGTVPQVGQPVRPPTTVGAGTTVGPQGGMIGVASTSTATSLRVYSGRSKYNEWVFVATQATNRISAPTGSQTPTGGMTVPGGAFGGRGGTPGQPGRGGAPPPGGRANPNQPAPFGRPGGNGPVTPPTGAPFGTTVGPGRGR
jgi:type II secretory pathway pseudopilin PulG